VRFLYWCCIWRCARAAVFAPARASVWRHRNAHNAALARAQHISMVAAQTARVAHAAI